MAKSVRKTFWKPSSPEPGGAEPVPSGWGSSALSTVSQTPDAVSIAEQLRMAEKKPHDRSWEKRENNRPILFRRVPPGLRDAIKEIADSLQVRADDVARAFLEFGVQCYQQGEIQIQPALSEGRLTLFPKSGDNWGKRPLPGWYEKAWDQHPPIKAAHRAQQSNKEPEKPWKWQVAYRGIPSEIQSTLREIHQKKSVPLGEVATLFLGHALDAYNTGRLVLNPQPRQPAGVVATTKQV